MQESVRHWLSAPIAEKLVAAAVGVLLVVVLVRLLQGVLSKHIEEANARYRTRKFVAFVGYVLSILVLVTVFSDKLGKWTVAVGIAGAGIAFALQEVIMSIAGSFALAIAQFYRTGDRVQLGGIKGDVMDIGILRTTLMEVGEWVNSDLYNGRVVRIANSVVLREPVFNYSGDFPFLWDEIVLPVRYGSDLRLAKDIFEKIANEVVGDFTQVAKASWKQMVKKYLIQNAEVEPVVTMTANENWVEFTLRYVVDYRKRRSTKDQLFVRILEAFEGTDGRVSVASTSMDVSLVPTPSLEVRMAGKASSDQS